MSDNMTRVTITLPLPMDVRRTITRLINAAYPEMLIEGNRNSMTFLIPEGAKAKA
jgi:hypothetical protein